MKKWLVILLCINIFTLVLAFFMVLSTSLFYAIILGLLGLLELIPLVALISCLDDIEDLKYEHSKLIYKLKLLEDENLPKTENDKVFNEYTYTETARAPWECVKCGTVNKAGTQNCSNCKAAYSAFVNPTDNPYVKKKISRWIKFK